MSNQNLEQANWLIRSTDNIVSGPFGKKHILQMIKAGEIKGKTELAPANSFWFYCDEKQLLEQYFPELVPGTATNLKNVTEKTKTLNQQLPLDGEITSSKIEMEKTQVSVSMETTTASKEDLDLLKKLQEAKPMPRIRRPEDLNKQSAALSEQTITKIIVPQPKSAFSQSPKLYAAIAVAVLALIGVLVWTSQNGGLENIQKTISGATSAPAPQETSPFDALQSGAKLAPIKTNNIAEAFLLGEYNLVQTLLREKEASVKADANFSIAQALFKGKFLLDNEGAVAKLEYAKGLLKGKTAQAAEVENLLGIYSVSIDPNYALERLRAAVQLVPNEKLYRFNYAAALLATRRFPLAEQQFAELSRTLTADNPLAVDSMLGLGMTLEQTRGLNDTLPEQMYRRVLEIDPQSTEGRILLAQRLLRKGDFQSADSHLRIFIDSLPEMDGQTNITNYRKLAWFGFYETIRSSLRDAQSVIKNSSVSISPATIAADAMITAILAQNVEAEQLATQALTHTSGSTDALKAILFLRYREGKDSEVIDLASEKAKDPSESFGLGIVIGKAYYRLGKYSQAAKIFSVAAQKSPDRADAWALLGEAHLAQGDNKEALQAFTKALEKNQFNLRAMRGMMRLGKSDFLQNPIYKVFIPI